METLEDVRILCHDPGMLNRKLHIGNIILAADLKDQEQKGLYNPAALVPDPSSIRPCTDAEITKFVHPIEDTERTEADVVLYLGNYAQAFWDQNLDKIETWTCLGGDTSHAGKLTTTINKKLPPGVPPREGIHLDSPDRYGHRLAVCTRGVRWLVIATRSAKSLLGTETPGKTGGLRRLFAANKNKAARTSTDCLFAPFTEDEFYDAYTSHILHDGSTWLNARSESGENRPASAVFFTQ